MAMASVVKVVLGSIAFAIFWVMAVFPSVPFLPVGRTAGSLLGAMLMVLFRVLTPHQAYDAIDLPILGLLFGTMVVSVYLERADMFKYLAALLSWKSRGAKDLLCRICLVSALASALFTNDTACVVLTEFVLKIARQHNLPPQPFLLALATSSNIGSAATPIGNPQNLVIAVLSGISFGAFLGGLLPAVLVGLVVNAVMLLVGYWNVLTVKKVGEDQVFEVAAVEAVNSHRFSPATLSHFSSHNSQDWSSKIEALSLSPSVSSTTGQLGQFYQTGPLSNGNSLPTNTERLRNRLSSSESEIHRVLSEALESRETAIDVPSSLHRRDDSVTHSSHHHRRDESVGYSNRIASVNGLPDVAVSVKSHDGKGAATAESGPKLPAISEKWKRFVWKCCVYCITLGMLVGLLCGLDMSWTAITAALALVVLDFQDAQKCLEKVSYSLLIFFCGMFITVEGFNKTGIPSTLWEMIEPHAQIDRVSGIAILALVILALSNLASNVPTVLLLGARVAASAAILSAAQEKKSWLILAWVSTVAGNLSLLGSAANLIVCEQARRAPELGYNLSFWGHLKFGVPSTLIVTAVGLTLIR